MADHDYQQQQQYMDPAYTQGNQEFFQSNYSGYAGYGEGGGEQPVNTEAAGYDMGTEQFPQEQ